MDKRPQNEGVEAEKNDDAGIDETKDVEEKVKGGDKATQARQETEASAKRKPETEGGKDKLSGTSEPRAIVLLLGNCYQSLTKYVKIVMAAKSHLTNMGWTVAGAFISAKALESYNSGRCAVPNPEHASFEEALREASPNKPDWIQMALSLIHI